VVRKVDVQAGAVRLGDLLSEVCRFVEADETSAVIEVPDGFLDGQRAAADLGEVLSRPAGWNVKFGEEEEHLEQN